VATWHQTVDGTNMLQALNIWHALFVNIKIVSGGATAVFVQLDLST
jgi:hypothetical protein